MALTFTIQSFNGGVSVAQQAAWDADLRNIANYLFRLCNYLVFKASGIVANNSGNTIYNPTTGQQFLGNLFVPYQFTVGDANTPMDVTNTILTIDDTNIVAGSMFLTVDEGEKPKDLTNRVSYDPIYSPNKIVATFNQALEIGQVVIYHYFKMGQKSGTVSKTSQPPLYYTLPSDSATVTFGELVGVPLADLRIISVGGTLVRPVLGATTDATQVQYDNGIAGIFTSSSGVFIEGSQIIVDYVS